jgi:diguanylate cyclase (GGDEF)-like protein
MDWHGLIFDITERKRIEAALAEREHEFRTLIENSPDTVARYGRDLRRLYVNPVLAALQDGGAQALLGKTPSECPGGPYATLYEQNLAEVFASEKEREFEYVWTDRNGRECCNLIRLTPEFGKDGAMERILAVGRSITELYASRQKIHQMAFYDALTSLPNRALFNERLRQMIADRSWDGERAGVMLIDMDRFKTVNDTMGHAVGDELLCETARRLSSCVRSYDTVARLGGDEFAVLLPKIRSRDDLGRIARKILGKFDEHFLLDGREVFVSCSIGIAVYPDDSAEAHDLLRYADSAMYFAKRSGRNNFRFYSQDLTASARARLTLESELRHAIARGQFALHYQPKVLLENGTIIGSEALLRWCHPQLGMVPPGQFIQVAEDTGLIVDIGNWVLREACRTASEWNADDGPLHQVAINLSARQFQIGDLAATMAAILEETACRPEWIELEITESLLLDEDDKTPKILTGLRAMGIAIAIDDFGTGYSALNYLVRFPIDTLKIDRSFIHGVTTEKGRAELVKAILSIASCLGQDVVAEGVETVEQAEFLKAHGCKIAQGYLYSKPLPKADVASLPRQFGAAG